MKFELAVGGMFALMVGFMIATYPGNAEERVDKVRTVEAKEVSCSEPIIKEFPKVGVAMVELVHQEPELVLSMGTFKVTAYCSCRECCGKWADCRKDGVVRGASGQELVAGYSIAVDPTVIPYGNEVYINGKKYVAHDCGEPIKGNCIDLYMSCHEEAVEWGVQYIEVFKAIDK